MSSAPSNPIDRLLQLGLDEGELLALIEGQALPSERVTAIARDPELNKLVSALRADHAALASLAGARAPEGLLDAVEARLEREALMGLAQASQASKDIPVSSVVVENEPVIGRIFASRWTSRLAIAASVVLVAGLGWSLIAPVIRGSQRPPVAKDTTPVTVLSEIAGETKSKESPANGASVSDAANIASKGESGPAKPEPVAPAIAKADAAAEPEPAPLSPERAIELAHAGRLGIKLRCASQEMARKNLTAQLPGGAALDVLPADRSALVIAQAQQQLNEQMLAQAKRRESRRDAGTPTLAGGTGTGGAVPASRPAEPAHAPASAPSLEANAWRVSIAPDEARLRSLIRRVTGKNADFSAELVELPASVELPAPLDLDQVLWWSRPAAQWDQRLSIPVVIERP